MLGFKRHLEEKLKASDDMSDWVKDFQDSDAPQFKGKSQKKRQQMAIAAKLDAEREAGMRKEAMDPVGKHDADIDNDGDTDKSDKYLIARRKAIGKALRKEEVDINEASDLRVTKVYNKFPKKATYAVHSPDRKYFKEFDNEVDAKKHLETKKEEVELDQETQYEIVESYLLENNIDVDSLTEQELNELIGKAIGGAFKLGAKAVVGAARRMSTSGQADAAEKRAAAAEKKNKDRERIKKAQARLTAARAATST